MYLKSLQKWELSIIRSLMDMEWINLTVILVPWCLCGWTNTIKVSFLIRLAAGGQRLRPNGSMGLNFRFYIVDFWFVESLARKCLCRAALYQFRVSIYSRSGPGIWEEAEMKSIVETAKHWIKRPYIEIGALGNLQKITSTKFLLVWGSPPLVISRLKLFSKTPTKSPHEL